MKQIFVALFALLAAVAAQDPAAAVAPVLQDTSMESVMNGKPLQDGKLVDPTGEKAASGADSSTWWMAEDAKPSTSASGQAPSGSASVSGSASASGSAASAAKVTDDQAEAAFIPKSTVNAETNAPQLVNDHASKTAQAKEDVAGGLAPSTQAPSATLDGKLASKVGSPSAADPVAKGSVTGRVSADGQVPPLPQTTEQDGEKHVLPTAEPYVLPTGSSLAVKPLYEYYNKHMGDHFLTSDPHEIHSMLNTGPSPLAKGWDYRGIVCFVSAKPVEGTVPLYRFFNVKSGDHAYSLNQVAFAKKADYESRGIAGYVYNTQLEGTAPIFEYLDTLAVDHIYKTKSVPSSLRPQTVHYLGIAWFAHMSPFSEHPDYYSKDATGTVPEWLPVPSLEPRVNYTSAYEGYNRTEHPNTPVQIAEYYNAESGDHMYTIDSALVKDKPQWKASGNVLGFAHSQPADGAVPLYRYFNRFTNDHMYTVDYKEANPLFGWTYLGIEAYVWTKADGDKRQPVNILFSDLLLDHAFTTSASEEAHLVALGHYHASVTAFYTLKAANGDAVADPNASDPIVASNMAPDVLPPKDQPESIVPQHNFAPNSPIVGKSGVAPGSAPEVPAPGTKASPSLSSASISNENGLVHQS